MCETLPHLGPLRAQTLGIHPIPREQLNMWSPNHLGRCPWRLTLKVHLFAMADMGWLCCLAN